jgi:Zn finger protein HypA/HybF involved in hydrogenase expression
MTEIKDETLELKCPICRIIFEISKINDTMTDSDKYYICPNCYF